VVHGDNTRGAWHVLYDDRRLALDMARQPIGYDTAVEIAAATGRKSDQHLDLLALKERRLGGGRAGGQRKQEGGSQQTRYAAHRSRSLARDSAESRPCEKS